MAGGSAVYKTSSPKAKASIDLDAPITEYLTGYDTGGPAWTTLTTAPKRPPSIEKRTGYQWSNKGPLRRKDSLDHLAVFRGLAL
jgi:hypothetical protein